jgi:hypothetical protein
MRSPRARSLLAFMAVTGLLAGLLAGPANAAPPVVDNGPATLAPGITYTRYRDSIVHEGASRTRRVSVLDIDVSTSATIDVMMPTSKLPGNGKMSAITPLRTVSGTTAIGAINGDFSWFVPPNGFQSRPAHPLQNDGALWQSGQEIDDSFAIRQNEARAYIDKPRMNVTVLAADGITPLFTVDRWNSGQPATAEIAAFSPEGGSAENPPSAPNTNFCMVRIQDQGGPSWTTGRKALLQTYTVVKKKCRGDTPLGESGETILMSRRGQGTQQGKIKALSVGQTIEVKTAMGFPGAVETIGGDPQIVDNGVNVAPPDGDGEPSGCGSDKTNSERNPRASIGVTQGCVDGLSTCHVLFVVVDGRQGSWSAGMTLEHLGDYLVDNLGVYDALNLDGGGSAGLWLKKQGSPDNLPTGACQTVAGAQNTTYGCYVSRPTTDGSSIEEREIESALVVTDGPDRFPTLEPVPSGP